MKFNPLFGGVMLVFVISGSSLFGQVLYLDPAATSWNSNSWSTTENGTYNLPWTDGNTAILAEAANISVNASVSVAGATLLSGGNSGVRQLSSTVTGTSINLSGLVNIQNDNRPLVFGQAFGGANKLGVTGSFEKTGAGALIFNTSSYDGSAGTVGAVTVSQGFVAFRDVDYTNSTTTDIISNGGFTLFAASGGVDFNIRNLSGNTGTVTANDQGSAGLNVHSTLDTTFGGTFDGSDSGQNLALTKSGSASLTLSGTVRDMLATTRVNQGVLIINSSNATFSDDAATTAIRVQSSGFLGGNGTITTTAGDHIVIENGGGLSPGALNATGDMKLSFGTGAMLDLSAMNTDARILFTLGTLSDKITLNSGSLELGTLTSGEFVFTLGSGFGEGQYLLFDTSTTITGTLDTSTFQLGGYTASLQYINSGQDIILNVVPEPAAPVLFLLGIWALRRRPHQPVL
jgi:hypothetical protein